MWKTVCTRVVALALAALGAACGGGSPSGAPDAPLIKQPALATEALPFHEVEVAAFSGVGEHLDVAVNDEMGWSSVWTRHTSNVEPAPARPAIDFSHQTVASVFLGKQTSCARPVIEGVARHGDTRIVVQYRVEKPPEGQACPAVVMAPVHMVRFENASRLPVDFRQR